MRHIVSVSGLKVGVYYFSQAVTVEEAREEAAYVLEQIAPYPISYPVVFDWERQNYSVSRTQKIPDTEGIDHRILRRTRHYV